MVAENPRRGSAARRLATKSILPTKLVPPALPAGYVPRERLDELLNQGAEGLVTLVSAHAGTGKTVLIASWAAARRDVAWLSLDRDDNWSPHFWRGVELALDRVDGVRATAGRRAHDPLARVGERIASRRVPVVLVLDDLHEIESTIVLKELDALFAHGPPQLRVIISTRADPRLRLQRLRLSGELSEIRASELAFTPVECRELLGPLSDELSEEDVETLCTRTEGWAAGVRLAALSLGREKDRPRFIARFAGDERAVADYLLTEILERQPAQRREFLLRTCVPDVLTAELAEELSGHAGAGRVLADLEAENFLVSSHSDRGDLYRYHSLLRDFLRAELGRVRPDELRLLHRRSATWSWRRGDAEGAFLHAVAGEDWDLADELTAEAWHVVVFGVATRAREAISEIPRRELVRRPGLALRVGVAHLLLGDRMAAERALALFEQALPKVDGDAREALGPIWTTFELTLARLDGDYERVEQLGQKMLTQPTGGTFEFTRRATAQRAVAMSSIGVAEIAAGRLGEAELHLHEALGLARGSGIDQTALNCLAQLALLEAARGRLRRAVELGKEAVEFAERRNWSRMLQSIPARLALAWSFFQWDELGLAEEHARHAEEVARHWGDRTGKVGAAVLSALRLATEGPEGAARGLRLLRGVRSELTGWTPPVYLALLLETAEARLLAARGDFVEAEAALTPGNGSVRDGPVVRARLLLAGGSPEAALELLESNTDTFGGLGLSHQIEADVLEAVARGELNDRAGADEALTRALERAEPHSYRRAFVDGGPAVRSLLVQQIRHGTDHRSLVADLIAAFERRAATIELTKPELLEPLSDREQAVLRYLPTMMSNAEIASELFVSVNTVKTHLKSVYRKLGTARRRDAVERARRLDLL